MAISNFFPTSPTSRLIHTSIAVYTMVLLATKEIITFFASSTIFAKIFSKYILRTIVRIIIRIIITIPTNLITTTTPRTVMYKLHSTTIA